MTYYTFDIYGRFAGTSDTPTDRSTEVAPAELSADYNFNGVDWVFAPGVLTTPVAAAPAPAAPARILTKLQYMDRFTDVELAGIYTAAKSVVQIEVWLEKFKIAQEINLDDPATITGVEALELGGLIGEGRAAEILG